MEERPRPPDVFAEMHPPDTSTTDLPRTDVIVSPESEDRVANSAIPGWAWSTFFHAALLLAIAFIQVPASRRQLSRIIRLLPATALEELNEWERIDIHNLEVGDESAGGELALEIALPTAPLVAESPAIDEPLAHVPSLASIDSSVAVATGEDFTRRFKTKGVAGFGTASAEAAIDRLTKEILLSLEERPTLVVWLLDQSASLVRQRKHIHKRLDRIYRELGAVQASGTFATYDDPLLSTVIAFGSEVKERLRKPTNDVQQLKTAVAGIERDDSGIENVFAAVLLAGKKYKRMRRTDPSTRLPRRNVMIIVISDEVGDDSSLADDATLLCQRNEIPVYVVGVPAPFGQQETMVKWVDPDPAYDQTPGWGLVNQGPESLHVERIRLGFETDPRRETPVDSGFGPFFLTRLCYETGGIYFAVHPDRDRRRGARRSQVQPFTSHIGAFFDPDKMRRYRPDYVSRAAYEKILRQNLCRMALVTAARQSWVSPMKNPRRRFLGENEAQLARQLTEAQKAAAILEPKLESLYSTLKDGEEDRQREAEPRWQAGYDLAMGRTLATLVRTKGYNAMLAQAKRGIQPTDPKNNTWRLVAAESVATNSELKRLNASAVEYLQRVVQVHPNTPWAYMAAKELEQKRGWKWQDSYTPIPKPQPNSSVARVPRMPRNEQVRQIARPEKRPVPKL